MDLESNDLSKVEQDPHIDMVASPKISCPDFETHVLARLSALVNAPHRYQAQVTRLDRVGNVS